jgi:hypothetical protein
MNTDGREQHTCQLLFAPAHTMSRSTAPVQMAHHQARPASASVFACFFVLHANGSDPDLICALC